MTVQLKDVIQEFAPPPEPPRPAEAAVAAESGIDGASALAFVAFSDGMLDLIALLEDETSAIEAGRLDGLGEFTRRKSAFGERMAVVLADRAEEGPPRLDAHMRERAAELIARLDRAVQANTGALTALREAVLAVNRSLLAAAEKAASDGVYGSSGHSLRPVELGMAGIDAQL
ncbi:flagellar protein FlgN [Arenibaculum pallidiluteum]|uniref:flagellar protein FlgN n=1 Tax=Arenibaculum pallidiluteum TaxID=2812559 RepID=UPI001A95B2B3|nr:flagellar protein FlgN [Arenibaculum pallidiluteum]